MRIRKSLQNKGKKRTFKANQTPSSSRQNIKEQKIFVILFCADSTVDLVKFELLRLTSLMHTMSVAVSLTTTNPFLFTINKPFSIIPPLSYASYTLQLSHPFDQPPLSDPPDAIIVRATMLPTGKATIEHLRQLFSKPGPHVFCDAVLNISLLTRLLKPVVECGSANVVVDLMRADTDATTTVESLMSLAIRVGSIQAVKLLEAFSCNIDKSVLHEVTTMDRIDTMKFVLERYGNDGKELDVDAVDSEGRTAIHMAAREGHVKVIKFCVSMG
ncbi:hypothetical protein GYH30_010266 [Glycine max]|nr:hypothetical protein GYH30_010266 [Glycine max]